MSLGVDKRIEYEGNILAWRNQNKRFTLQLLPVSARRCTGHPHTGHKCGPTYDSRVGFSLTSVLEVRGEGHRNI